MQLKEWLETEAHVPDSPVPGATTPTISESYAKKLTDAGIRDDDQDLPEVGLTWEGLKEIGVAVGYRHRILEAIQKMTASELTPAATRRTESGAQMKRAKLLGIEMRYQCSG